MEAAAVAIGVAAGSLVITATIAVPSAPTTGGVTVDTVTASLASTLGTIAAASSALGLPVLIAPSWVVEAV